MGSILAIGILLVKGILKQKLSARFHYYIWFLLVLRLLIPLSVESPISLLNFIPQYQQSNIPYIAEQNLSNIKISNTNSNNSNLNLEDSNNNSVDKIKKFGFNFKTLALVWLIGTSVILLYIISINILLSLRLKKYPKCDKEDIIRILEQCKSRLKINFKVSIVYYGLLKSPMLYGVIKPKILISPEIINSLSEEELKYVFMHELAHIKRRDLIMNVIVMLIQAIYWFNPIIWYSIYKMKQDCEISCDATVLTALSSEENKRYGETIISMMKVISERYWISGTVGFASKYNKRRIIMITLFKKTSIKWTGVAVLSIAILAVGCLRLSIPSSKNEEIIEKQLMVSNTSDISKQDTTKISSAENNENSNELKADSNKNSFLQYINLLGLSKEKLLSTLNEEPNSVDEGGLEFKKAGIRVWFDQEQNASVSQIFTQRTDIDLNGVKLGDKVDKFKKAFGNPVSDENGDIHFKYKEDSFISVIYDSKTEETKAVYFLKENF